MKVEEILARGLGAAMKISIAAMKAGAKPELPVVKCDWPQDTGAYNPGRR